MCHPMKILRCCLPFFALCQPLSSATVEAVKGAASARSAQTVAPGQAFTTRKSSQSQLRLDKGFVRLGSSSEVQVGKEDAVHLKEGVMMVGSSGQKKRQTVKVSAPGYSFQVQGTALIAYYPGQYIKITVLEGRIRVALQSLLGEFETIEAGQMLVINPADKRLPDPVEVDLNRLVTTSQLTTGSLGPPPTDPFIQSSVTEQSAEKGGGFLTQTPFALRGASPEVTIFQLVNDLDDPNKTVTEKDFVPADPSQLVTLADTTLTRTGAKTRTLNVMMKSRPENDGSLTLPSLSGNITVDEDVFGGAPQKLAIIADDTLLVKPGANVHTPARTALELRARALDIQDATLRAGDATLASEELTLTAYGRDSSQEFDLQVRGSTVEAGQVTLRGASGGGLQSLGVDGTTITAPRGISVGSSTEPLAITIRNSSELAALAGSIRLDSGGSPITVDGSRLRADPQTGQIVIDALETGGLVTLRNATLSADVIKARGHSASGDAVIVDGGSFIARSVLKFYAAGASILRFRGNVTLDSPLSVLAARTVEVEAGGLVTSNGRIDIYTNNPRFNSPGQVAPGFGTIQSTTSVPVVLPFDSPAKPSF